MEKISFCCGSALNVFLTRGMIRAIKTTPFELNSGWGVRSSGFRMTVGAAGVIIMISVAVPAFKMTSTDFAIILVNGHISPGKNESQ